MAYMRAALAAVGLRFVRVQWRITYLLSVAMSLDDDTCQALIEAVKIVLTDCGVEFNQPSSEHYKSMKDYMGHVDEVWDDIRKKARGKSLRGGVCVFKKVRRGP